MSSNTLTLVGDLNWNADLTREEIDLLQEELTGMQLTAAQLDNSLN
jgi:hypothetical protein